MSRSVADWVGKTDDTAIPPRVRVRVFQAKDGRCHKCRRKINGAAELWTCEHMVALINWTPTADMPHGNRESNLDVTCCNCLPEKNAADVAEKSAVYKTKAKHILPKAAKRPWPKRAFGRKGGSNTRDINADIQVPEADSEAA